MRRLLDVDDSRVCDLVSVRRARAAHTTAKGEGGWCRTVLVGSPGGRGGDIGRRRRRCRTVLVDTLGGRGCDIWVPNRIVQGYVVWPTETSPGDRPNGRIHLGCGRPDLKIGSPMGRTYHGTDVTGYVCYTLERRPQRYQTGRYVPPITMGC